MRAFLRGVLSAALVIGTVIPGPAAASAPSRHGVTDPEALAHVDTATAAFEIGDYDKAAIHLKAAYAIEQRPELLFAWAQVERLAGNYRVAGGLYEAFLEQVPDSASAGEAKVYVIEMRALVGDDPEPDAAPPDAPSSTEEPVETPQEDDTSTRSASKGEWLAPTLLGIGGVAAIAGGVLLGLGRNQVTKSAGAPTEQAYFAEIDAGRRVYFGGVATLAAGGLLIAGGAVRYALVARGRSKAKPQAARAAPVVTRTGFGLSLSGRF